MADDPPPPSMQLDLPPGAVVVSWVAVVEWIDTDGAYQLSTLDSPGLPWWRRTGMLEALDEMAWVRDDETADEDGE